MISLLILNTIFRIYIIALFSLVEVNDFISYVKVSETYVQNKYNSLSCEQLKNLQKVLDPREKDFICS